MAKKSFIERNWDIVLAYVIPSFSFGQLLVSRSSDGWAALAAFAGFLLLSSIMFVFILLKTLFTDKKWKRLLYVLPQGIIFLMFSWLLLGANM